jgi:hypothetical protein
MYETRRTVNDQSRNQADKHREFWEAAEIELLEEAWSTEPLEEIAAVLERTVEACRQKHYDLKHVRQAGRKETAKLNAWSKGFTSLADMGY